MNLIDNKTPYGETLRCPSCDGFNFHLYRSNIHGNDELVELANCLDCHTATYALALKDKYHDDKGEDFEIIGRIKHTVTFECGECRRQYKDEKKIYEETMYDGTTFTDIDPEPELKCPEHPNATGSLLIEDVEEGWKDEMK